MPWPPRFSNSDEASARRRCKPTWTPTEEPGVTHSLLHQRRLLTGLRFGQLAEEVLAFVRPPPTNLESEDHEPSPGHWCYLRRRAAIVAAPSTSGAPRIPSRPREDTMVVSIVSQAPWNNGNPSAMTSKHRESAASGAREVRVSDKHVLPHTSTGSRHTRAVADS